MPIKYNLTSAHGIIGSSWVSHDESVMSEMRDVVREWHTLMLSITVSLYPHSAELTHSGGPACAYQSQCDSSCLHRLVLLMRGGPLSSSLTSWCRVGTAGSCRLLHSLSASLHTLSVALFSVTAGLAGTPHLPSLAWWDLFGSATRWVKGMAAAVVRAAVAEWHCILSQEIVPSSWVSGSPQSNAETPASRRRLWMFAVQVSAIHR